MADEILKKYELEYEQWYEFRDLVPVVKKISRMAGEDTAARLKKAVRRYPLSREEREELLEAIDKTAAKVAAKLCYGLREEMEPEKWQPCLEGLMRSAEKLE